MSMNKYKDDKKFSELCQTRIGRLQCFKSKFDRQGAVTDTLEFKFGEADTLLYLSTFFGSSYTLNPGAHHQAFTEELLTQEEKDYVWECHKFAGIFI